MNVQLQIVIDDWFDKCVAELVEKAIVEIERTCEVDGGIYFNRITR